MASASSSEDESDTPRTPLDTSRAQRKVILLKVPPELHKRWQEQLAAGSHEPLGHISFEIDLSNPTAPPETTLTLAKKDGESPDTYKSKRLPEFLPSMRLFSVAPDGTLAADGTIKSKFHLQRYDGVSDLDEYGAVFRERMRKSASARPTSKVLKNDPRAGGNLNEPNGQGKKKGSEPARRRMRRDSKQVEAEVFKLFEENRYWRLKDLVQKVDQPVAHVKKILNLLCEYNTQGKNHGAWELKPEYRH